MSRSIIPGDNPGECYICSHYGRPPEALREECAHRGAATPQQIEEHHIFGGPFRKFSEHYGIKVHLCTYHHTSGSEAVHNNRTWDLRLKQIGQKAFEERYSHGMWMQVFERDYIAEEPPEDRQTAQKGEHGTKSGIWTTGAPSGEKKMAQVNECVTDCGNLKCRYNAANIKEKNVFLVFMRDKKGCEGYKRLKKAERKGKAVETAGEGENAPKKKAGAPEKDRKITPKNVRKTRAAAGGAKEKKSRAAAGRAKTKRTGSTAKRTQEAGRTTARKERGK